MFPPHDISGVAAVLGGSRPVAVVQVAVVQVAVLRIPFAKLLSFALYQFFLF